MKYPEEIQASRDKVLKDIEVLRVKHYWEMAKLEMMLMSIHDNYGSKELSKHTQGSDEWKDIQKKFWPQYN